MFKYVQLFSVVLMFQEAPLGRYNIRQLQITREQPQIIRSPQDKSLTSETKVPITSPTLSIFPSETLSNETQVMMLIT